jgi:asparaginyl-tRNA synthetase
LQLRDGTATIQCVVFKGDVDETVFTVSKALTQETALEIQGIVKADTRSTLGVELAVTGLRVLHQPETQFPITPKEHGVAFLMDHRHLWLRSSRQHAILRIRATVFEVIQTYLNTLHFTRLEAPIFTPNACEGTSNLFETDYFEDRKAYLTQSGQLYMEAGAAAFGRVYCLGPTFRAEKSKTRRHLTEFWMLEPEVAFLELEGNMQLAESLVRHIGLSVLARHEKELALLERDTQVLEALKDPFPRLSYDDAIALLHQHGKTEVQWGDDLGSDEETLISQQFKQPVIIHRYPKAIKPFYMKLDPENPERVLNMDIIASDGYGEMIGGSQREDSLSRLEAEIKHHGLPEEAFRWYADLRRYGSFPHSGFGLGIERTVAWLCGIHHVRETIPFPRLLDRLTP